MIQKTITIFDQAVPCEVRVSKRAQRLRIAVYAEGKVVVTQPYAIDDSAVEKYLNSKKDWLYKKLEGYRAQSEKMAYQSKNDDLAKHKVDAYILARSKLQQWNKLLGFAYSDVIIKDLKTRWGSCSPNGELTFNYRILFLPDDLQDYVIAHELCHLRVLNHTKRFWQLVESVLPNYQELAKTLRML